MARKRMIDPNFWRDEKVGGLNFVERLVFIGLWNFADDAGIGRANPSLLKCDIFPYDDKETPATMEKHLTALAAVNLIKLYKVDGQGYFFVNNFEKYQNINRPTPSKLPPPDAEGAQPWGSEETPLKQGVRQPSTKTKGDYGEFQNVKLTAEEYGKLIERFGKPATQKAIEELGAYMKSKGKQYKDHYATLLNWVKRDMPQGGGVNYDEE